MKLVRSVLLLVGLVMPVLASCANADFNVALTQKGGGSYSNGGNGPWSLTAKGVTFTISSITHVDTASDGYVKFTLTSTGAGTVNFGVNDLTSFTAFTGSTANLITTISGATNVKSASLSAHYQDTDGETYVSSSANYTTTPPIPSDNGTNTVSISSPFNPSSGYSFNNTGDITAPYAISGGSVFFGGAGSVTFEAEVKSVPEPISMAMGILGVPCMGGLVHLVRRRRGQVA